MNEDDRTLVDQVLSGETDAFAGLVRRHHARIMGLCVSMLGDRTRAEDASQEVFLKAFKSLEDFRGASSFGTWLHRIAVNRCLDLMRRQKRQTAEPLDAIPEREAPQGDGSLEDADLVRRLLDSLSPDYRAILTLRELQGLGYKEIMEVLGISMDAVKARLRRARQSLLESARHISTPDSV
ncbi:MAG: RNA polymerase sigma factor [Elusimicrobiota bacterium]